MSLQLFLLLCMLCLMHYYFRTNGMWKVTVELSMKIYTQSWEPDIVDYKYRVDLLYVVFVPWKYSKCGKEMNLHNYWLLTMMVPRDHGLPLERLPSRPVWGKDHRFHSPFLFFFVFFSILHWFPPWQRSGNRNLHDQLSWSLSVCGREMSGQYHRRGEQPTATEDLAGQGQPALSQGHSAIHRGGSCARRLHLLCEWLEFVYVIC